MRKKIASRSKAAIENFHKDLESSEYALSLKDTNFAIPPMFATKKMTIQVKEVNGKEEFDTGKYHNPRYNDLMKKLIVYRAEFPKVKDL